MRLFNRVSLSTPESVELEFTLAGIGSRTLALLIDYNILILILLGFWFAWLVVFLGITSYLGQSNADYSQIPYWLLAIAFLGTFIIYSGYFVFFEVTWQGQSPGKRFAKIRVIREDGRPVGMSQAVMRSLLRAIDDFCFIGVFFIVFSKREKRIGDWVAGTLVVQQEPNTDGARAGLLRRRSRSSAASEAPLHSSQTQELADKLATIADVGQLLPDDFAVIQEYLRRRSKLEPRARTEKSMQLAHQLRTLIQLETIPPNTTSDQFIEAVYLAYQNYSDSSQGEYGL